MPPERDTGPPERDAGPPERDAGPPERDAEVPHRDAAPTEGDAAVPPLREHHVGATRLLLDPRRIPRPDPALFEPDHWRAAGRLAGAAPGRGPTYFVEGERGEPWVLRHYRRGGLAGRVSEDRYVWLGARAARPFRELRVLAALRSRGLPVPDPVGARVVRTGSLRYRGDLLTVRVPGRPLNEQLLENRPDPGPWRLAGTWVRAFHDAGVDHADLHGGNILVAGETVHLIDFDRARIRRPRRRWQLRNLARFQRSVRKILGPAWGKDPAWRECWKAFEAGYAAGPRASSAS